MMMRVRWFTNVAMSYSALCSCSNFSLLFSCFALLLM
uniref:Uncharacterized protein n=1 Tax=Arundo donax TaxID=35708 RepID=A0A0A9CKT0_ARUDO